MSTPSFADLLAAQDFKPKRFERGEEVEGEIAIITGSEIILDLGAKSEGIINKNDLTDEQAMALQVGDSFHAFVHQVDRDSGQIVLSPYPPTAVARGKRGQEQMKKWQGVISAFQKKTNISGKVLEVNKGGLLADIGGIRGFIPSSQIGIEHFTNEGLSGVVGQNISLSVVEVDPINNRLILSARKPVSPETKEKLSKMEAGQKVTAKVIGAAPFGLFLDLDGVEGMVFPQEVSWEEEIPDLVAQFAVGQEVEGQIVGKDDDLGRVLVSLRRTTEDPFEKIAENFMVDDVVSGTVTEITQNGVNVALDGVEGFIPAEKIDGSMEYTVGQTTNFLVDTVDARNRRINLAPFLTSTKGLIYK